MSSLTIFPGRGPRWLRWLLDRSSDTRLLNDALYAAAGDLDKRPPQNRKIIIVISDGHAAKNLFSFQETRDRLTRSQIQFYAVNVNLPMLERATSMLFSYASATGGDIYSGRTQGAMQRAFSSITEQARHQYVLSYVSNNETPGLLPVSRRIEVKTERPGLTVHHRNNYLQYPRPK
jgi:hypothetical protein